MIRISVQMNVVVDAVSTSMFSFGTLDASVRPEIRPKTQKVDASQNQQLSLSSWQVVGGRACLVKLQRTLPLVISCVEHKLHNSEAD